MRCLTTELGHQPSSSVAGHAPLGVGHGAEHVAGLLERQVSVEAETLQRARLLECAQPGRTALLEHAEERGRLRSADVSEVVEAGALERFELARRRQRAAVGNLAERFEQLGDVELRSRIHDTHFANPAAALEPDE